LVAPGAEWRDPQWKYSLDTQVEAITDRLLAEECEQMSMRLSAAIGLSGAYRFDFFVSSGTVFVGEVNAIPGQGIASTFPRIFEASGITRSRQFELMVSAALDAHAASTRLRIRI